MLSRNQIITDFLPTIIAIVFIVLGILTAIIYFNGSKIWVGMMGGVGYLLGIYLRSLMNNQQEILNTSQNVEFNLYNLVKLPHTLILDFGYKISAIFGLFFISTTKIENYSPLIEFQTQFNQTHCESENGTFYFGCHDIPTDQKWRSLPKQRQQYYQIQIKKHITNVQLVLQKHIPGVKFRPLTLNELLKEYGFEGDVNWDGLLTTDSIFLGKVRVTHYRDDVLVLTKEHPDNPKNKEKVLISIIGLTTEVKDNFQLLNRVGEGQLGVSNWRWNRVEERKKKHYSHPRKNFTTQNFIVIKSSLQNSDSFFPQPLKYLYDQLLETQNDVLSVIKNGFDCTFLKNEDLKQVFLHKTPIEVGKGKVKYDQAYFRAIAQLTRVPSRTIPLLPCNSAPINIPLGTHFLNPEKTVGLGVLSKLLVFCGSDQKLLIRTLQYFIKAILAPYRKIIIFDFNNELGGLVKGLNRTRKDKIPLTVLQLGKNFSLNFYDIEIPSYISKSNTHIAYQINTVVHLLVYASETEELVANLSHLRNAMVEASQNLAPEELSLQNIMNSDVFTDISRNNDYLTLERLVTELKLFSTYPELNEGGKYSEVESNIGRTPGVTVFQFPTQPYALKRAVVAFLLQKLAFRCDAQTVVIVTHASKIFGKENIHPQRRIFEDAINQHYTKILQSGCLVLATHSVTALHPEVQKDISTGIFFKLMNVEDRDWLTVRYALEARLADNRSSVSAFLKNLQGEGLLFREDANNTFDHFIPFTLDTIESIDVVKDGFLPSLDMLALNEEQFALLMTVLGQIQNQDVTEQAIIQYLQDLGFTNVRNDWDHFCKLPYFTLTQNGNDRVLSISGEGTAYYAHIDNIVSQLPPPISLNSLALDSTLKNLRHRVEKSSQNDRVEQHQLKTVIGEVAGAILNEYLRIQEIVDWCLVKRYIDLLEIEGIHPDQHIQRFELLELLFTKIEEKLRIEPPL